MNVGINILLIVLSWITLILGYHFHALWIVLITICVNVSLILEFMKKN